VRFLHSLAHETAGAASTRHSLRPLYFWANGFCKTSGALRREIAEVYLDEAVIARSEATKQSIITSHAEGWIASLRSQ
jgi:hypothetical protein